MEMLYIPVYVEIFMRIIFLEIVKKLAPRNVRSSNFHEYVACLVLLLPNIFAVFIFANAD